MRNEGAKGITSGIFIYFPIPRVGNPLTVGPQLMSPFFWCQQKWLQKMKIPKLKAGNFGILIL
jgi:hypothetical protein